MVLRSSRKFVFDIGFWELSIIAIVGLLVLGPERLPDAARTAGLWVRRIRRFVANTSAEIERELNLEEMKRQHQQQLDKLQRKINEEIALDPEPDREAGQNPEAPSDRARGP